MSTVLQLYSSSMTRNFKVTTRLARIPDLGRRWWWLSPSPPASRHTFTALRCSHGLRSLGSARPHPPSYVPASRALVASLQAHLDRPITAVCSRTNTMLSGCAIFSASRGLIVSSALGPTHFTFSGLHLLAGTDGPEGATSPHRVVLTVSLLLLQCTSDASGAALRSSR